MVHIYRKEEGSLIHVQLLPNKDHRTRRNVMLILLCLSLLFCGSGTTLLALSKTSVVNHFTTGVVDIELEEYEIQDGQEVPYENPKEVMPGTTISKIPRITNDGNDCYVRAEITFENMEDLNDSNLFGFSSQWEKIGDYYYYKDILEHGESVDLFEGLEVPTSFSQEHEEEEFSIRIDVDAIQSQNFTPDFTSSIPWGNIEIMEYTKGKIYDVSSFKQADDLEFEIEYQGDTEKLVKNQEDFFLNIPVLLPGDFYEDSVEISNDGDRDITLYFDSEILENQDILEKIQLKIETTIDGTTETVYEGSLNSSIDHYELGKIKANQNASFDFSIEVPPELNNDYTLEAGKVKWIFSTEPIEKTDGIAEDVTTGDFTQAGLLLIVAGVALFGVVLYQKKK